MMRAANIPMQDFKKNILFFAALNCLAFIIAVLSFKYLNLLHLWGLRVSNYLILAVISVLQVKRLMKINKGYLPFLQSYFTALITGTMAFAFFAIFILFYSFIDPTLPKMFIVDSDESTRLMPFLILFFEGSGASIIVSLIVMLYASRFEEGESYLP